MKKKLSILVAAALLCLLIMLAILTVMYLMDDTLKSSEDVEKHFGILPLTVIPEGKIEGLTDTSETNAKRHRFAKKAKLRKKKGGRK